MILPIVLYGVSVWPHPKWDVRFAYLCWTLS